MHLLTNANKSGQLLLTGITFQWGADSKNNASVCSLQRLRGASVIRAATCQKRFQALADSQNREKETCTDLELDWCFVLVVLSSSPFFACTDDFVLSDVALNYESALCH